MLSTLVRPTSGEVRYGGATAATLGDALRGRIGVLGHDLFLYGDLTARENLEFFGRLYGLDRLDARVAAALAAARLEDRAGDRVASFSRGLRQRLALERALIHEPRLVLLDEPFTGLDDESAALLGARLRALRDAGAIVLMATHDFESADGLVDRMICLRAGQVREIAPAGGIAARALPARDGGGVVVSVLRAAWLIARKDLLVEARSRELAYTTLFFAVACVLVFSFAFVREGRAIDGAAAGILWVADRVLRHAGARPGVRARAAVGDAARAAAGAGRAHAPSISANWSACSS